MAAIGNSKLPALIAVVFVVLGTMSLWGQEFAGGNGTTADPWQIATAEHLNNVRNYLGAQHNNKHFIQTANIELEDFLWDEDEEDYINDGEGWIPIGNEENRFTGKYNGNGKTISGLFISRVEADNQGLFGYTDAAVINNLGVIDVEITGHEAVGGLAGLVNNTTVTNCYSTGNVTGVSHTGGLAGRSSGNSEVFDCHSDVTVSSFYIPTGMVFVQGGTFNPTANYTVNLSSFYISKYEVTQSEWTSVMGGAVLPEWRYGQGPNHPVYWTNWYHTILYCNLLSIREGLTPAYSYGTFGTNPDNWPANWNSNNVNHTNVRCNWDADGYRLPTEMEWELVARGGVPAQNAGTFNDFWAGANVEAELGDYAWYQRNSGDELLDGNPSWDDMMANNCRSHPVGTKLPNELGVYDMSGNVWEWVWDLTDEYNMTPYPSGVHNNPTGPTTGNARILRGGSWDYRAAGLVVRLRACQSPYSRWYSLGFRVCRRIP